MGFTADQQQAIRARGNVLVVAGAGTGKTSTLVERCLDCLLHEKPRASLEELLVVTFTDAAAAEVRQRIRNRLTEELAKNPGDTHWQEQLALFETAHIGTLHSFCLQLIRQHFYGLELDPQLAVLAEEESRLLADETLEGLLQKHYAGKGSTAEAVQQLIQAQGRGWDKPIRTLVLRLHHYTQTLPDPAGWFRQQISQFARSQPDTWQEWLLTALAEWSQSWARFLDPLAATNDIAGNCAAALKQLPANPTRAQAGAALEAITAALQNCPRGKKTEWVKPLTEFFADADFLRSLTTMADQKDPLAEDWAWVRFQMTTLLQLAREFTEAYTDAKRELGAVDFHDLEQYSLQLLWDAKANQPTPIALQWRKRLRFVFVDEYQDINAAQDKIIEALSRPEAEANRFLVGDIKQSIYRFRLANPYIFQGYLEQWSQGTGQVIPLVDNFRSREGILQFTNSLFELVMRREIGGVPYDERARLRFGAAQERSALSAATAGGPRVELQLRLKTNNEWSAGDSQEAEALAEVRDMEEADKEARQVGLRLRELQGQGHRIWDEKAKHFRAADWSDMAILLRSPSNKAESYAKEFAKLKIPLQVERGGFYQSLEISDLLSLLRLLDNPLQDLPVLAVLRSPLVGLTLNELATIRLAVMKTHFWTALMRWEESHRPEEGAATSSAHPSAQATTPTLRKVSTFLERFARWRRLARQVSLSRCLEAVLAETHYATWLLTQPRGEQRHTNVRRLVALAQQFDQFQRQGLFRFLRFIEAQQLAETEPEVAAVAEENAVRLMSIHQSKGLEFPVVVLADLGKPFNMGDLNGEIMLDEAYGLCPQVKPPHTGQRYPSLPYWLARRRQKRELLGEELRLLYVALTRARDTLLLSGSLAASKFEKVWGAAGAFNPAAVLNARSYADWLGLWFAQHVQNVPAGALEGETDLLRWVLHDDSHLLGNGDGAAAETTEANALPEDPQLWQTLKERLEWQYRFGAATRQPAKTSVSALRRRAAELTDPESVDLFGLRSRILPAELSTPHASGTDIGNAHHTFLQLVSLPHTGSLAALKQEAQRLEEEGALSPAEGKLLDFKALAAFWNSALGRKIRDQAPWVHRELSFTARFAPAQLAALTGESPDARLAEEFVVVQGVADLAVIRPEAIWLLDFKTDHLAPGALMEKARTYGPQLKLYAQALAQIYRRPVSESWLYFLSQHQGVELTAVLERPA